MDRIYLKHKELDTEYITLNTSLIELNHRRESFQYTDLSFDILDRSVNYDNLIEKLDHYNNLINSNYFALCIPNIFDNEVGNCLIGDESSRTKIITKVINDEINFTIKFQLSGYEISEEYPKWLVAEIRDHDISELLK